MPLFWTICVLGWMAILVITASSIFFAGFRPVGLVIKMTLALWTPYVALTPLVFLLARRFPITSSTWRSAIGIHLVASIVFVVVCEGAFLGLVRVLGPAVRASYAAQRSSEQADTENWVDNTRSNDPNLLVSDDTGLPLPSVRMAGVKAVANLPLYWVLVAFIHALLATARLRQHEQHAAELAAHLAQAHLAGLRTQLQPHFLFNTLNSISALITQDAQLANEMVLNLSDLLRMTLRDPERGEIPLSEELRLLGHYVEIQRLRFGNRLGFKLEVDSRSLDCPIPPLLLQPLVENAVRHGIEPSDRPELITVQARLEGNTLMLEVLNTGQAPQKDSPAFSKSTGLGLRNTRDRLAALYGALQTFQYGLRPEGGFRVGITLPRVGSKS